MMLYNFCIIIAKWFIKLWFYYTITILVLIKMYSDLTMVVCPKLPLIKKYLQIQMIQENTGIILLDSQCQLQ